MATQVRALPRSLVVLLTVSVVVNLLLAAAGAFVVIRQLQLSGRIHDSQIQACEQSNSARRQDIAIWNRLLDVPGPKPRSARREIADLTRLVKAKDTPVNCAALYRT